MSTQRTRKSLKREDKDPASEYDNTSEDGHEDTMRQDADTSTSQEPSPYQGILGKLPTGGNPVLLYRFENTEGDDVCYAFRYTRMTDTEKQLYHCWKCRSGGGPKKTITVLNNYFSKDPTSIPHVCEPIPWSFFETTVVQDSDLTGTPKSSKRAERPQSRKRPSSIEKETNDLPGSSSKRRKTKTSKKRVATTTNSIGEAFDPLAETAQQKLHAALQTISDVAAVNVSPSGLVTSPGDADTMNDTMEAAPKPHLYEALQQFVLAAEKVNPATYNVSTGPNPAGDPGGYQENALRIVKQEIARLIQQLNEVKGATDGAELNRKLGELFSVQKELEDAADKATQDLQKILGRRVKEEEMDTE